MEGRKEREREKPTNQPTNRRSPCLLFHRKGIQWFAILFQSRFCNGTSSYHILERFTLVSFVDKVETKVEGNILLASRPRWAKLDGCRRRTDGRWTANFVRYTVEIFSLDLSWKARVNEFGKGLVNIRWLLNLCTRVNKYCACGTQEIREPEIVPAIYIHHIRVFLILFF